ncbi:MAG: nucleoside triphosphate pyrophosphohydrolase [Candidatus Marinimicrobia bacterium]|nr:nucleoside triphosphate pyrophosphohydrolase [Candidatus Neomarinimicrobiota bacterium]
MIDNSRERTSTQFLRLMDILTALRGENGCPWDKEQTAKSLIPYLLEETYEIIEAVEENDTNLLKEELGDLMLHLVFQAHIANEEGKFHIADSIQHICDKLERRHPHVFGTDVTSDRTEIKFKWESIKQKEKRRSSLLEGVPKNLPALTRARRVQEKASNVGFDWETIDPVWMKLDEEIAELKEAYRGGDGDQIEEELGDVLFSLVNLGRFLNISSEEALRFSISKFETRFRQIEKRLSDEGKSVETATLEEMDAIWDNEKEKRRLEKHTT